MHAQGKVVGLHVYWASQTSRIDMNMLPEKGQPSFSQVKDSKKVEVNGQTAVLVHVGGKSNEDTEHAALVIPMDGYILEFTQDGVRYTIAGNTVSADDLIKVAKSLR